MALPASSTNNQNNDLQSILTLPYSP
jgi:hypothetical protein